MLKCQTAVDDDRLARYHRRTEAEEDDDLGDVVRSAAPFQRGTLDGRASLLLSPFDHPGGVDGPRRDGVDTYLRAKSASKVLR
jgi:hypothetical protein